MNDVDDLTFLRALVVSLKDENEMLKEKIANLEHRLNALDNTCAGLDFSALHPDHKNESGAV